MSNDVDMADGGAASVSDGDSSCSDDRDDRIVELEAAVSA